MATKKGVIRFADKVNKTHYAKLTFDTNWYFNTSNSPITSPVTADLKNFESPDDDSVHLAAGLLKAGINIVIVIDIDDEQLVSHYCPDELERPTDAQLIKSLAWEYGPIIDAYAVSPGVDISGFPDSWAVPTKLINQFIEEFRVEEKKAEKYAESNKPTRQDIIKQIKTLEKELAKYGK
jgi:hypothetical protein